MADYPNFYESLQEARMRLDQTIVLYDDDPYYVLTVCDHKPDGIFRVYLDPLVPEGSMNTHRTHIPMDAYDEGPGNTRGHKMDRWMESQKDCTVLRKMMNSPSFKKFRPFPLGMANYKGSVQFVERGPVRHTQQGLMNNMLHWSSPDVFKAGDGRRSKGFPFLSNEMYQLIKGVYPSLEECVENFNDPAVTNTSVAFDRNFALVRGPLGLIFLAYKSDIVGYLPNSDLSMVKVDNKFGHVREAIDDLGKFGKIF